MSLVSAPWCRDALDDHLHRVLVADDERAIAALVADFLELEGYLAVTAPDGAEALAEARRERPCLALVDLMMPVMNGATFIAACRADACLSQLPIVVLTAAIKEVEARGLPVQGFVPKPFELHRLLAAVVTVLGGTNGHAVDLGADPLVLRRRDA